jgi:hypothetical protein
MTNNCLKQIEKAIELAEKMIQLADDVEVRCDDDHCLVVYGVIRDSAYKIRRAAEQETQAIQHQNL